MSFSMFPRRATVCRWLALAACALPIPALAASFSVSPIRADLRPGVLSETVTVTNDSPGRLRVLVKLYEWTQDAAGNDMYAESSDLVYFPRQMELEPGAKRLVRVGAKAPAQGSERAYRLFIEEVPSVSAGAPATVSFYFRFGVPVFVTPPGAAPRVDIPQPRLAGGTLSLDVHNPGTQHFRAARVSFSDGAGWTRDVGGWYSLPGTSRSYQVLIPREICGKAKVLSATLEADDGAKFERSLNVDLANCS